MTPFSFALAHSLPEAILGVGALVLLMLGVFRAKDGRDWLVSELAIGVLSLAFVTLFFNLDGGAVVWSGSFVDDAFGRFMKALALAGAIGSLLLSLDFMRREGIDLFEFPVLIVIASLGMCMLISARDLIALYLGLELMSLSLYVMAAFHRDDARASEAGLKYFALGALSSGMLLYGSSLVYGFAGSVQFDAIAKAFQGATGLGAVFGVVFLLAALSFKMSLVPFHMWTPDVYEGAPTPVTTFFASAAKMAAVAIAARVVSTAFPGIVPQWRQIVVFTAILSMAVGAFAAIGQTNIKRLMAYSSIGHMGFAMVGLAAGNESGVQGVLMYMAIYLIMTLGAFAAILSMRITGTYVENIGDLAGLARRNGPMAFFLAANMLSLAGIPPLAGFWAKWFVFMPAVNAGLYPLAVIGVLLSTVACFYYLRVVKIMYFDEPGRAFDKASPAVTGVLAASSLLIVLFSFWPGPVVSAAAVAAHSLF
jgi:NADH-quinone oxidoreductase subunit N